MSNPEQTETQKWMISFWAALVFVIIASPFMFNLVDKIAQPIGMKVANNGCPTIFGLLLHAVVFAVIIRLMMDIKLPGVSSS